MKTLFDHRIAMLSMSYFYYSSLYNTSFLLSENCGNLLANQSPLCNILLEMIPQWSPNGPPVAPSRFQLISDGY